MTRITRFEKYHLCYVVFYNFSGGPNEYKMIHAIETVVIEWVHQLKDVLKKDPTQALLDGHNPSPFVEIKFWENKAANLECIYEQVKQTYFYYINFQLYKLIKIYFNNL